MNNCCKETLQKLQNKLAKTSGDLLAIAGDRKSLMQEAAYRKAEMLVDVMAIVKKFVEENK